MSHRNALEQHWLIAIIRNEQNGEAQTQQVEWAKAPVFFSLPSNVRLYALLGECLYVYGTVAISSIYIPLFHPCCWTKATNIRISGSKHFPLSWKPIIKCNALRSVPFYVCGWCCCCCCFCSFPVFIFIRLCAMLGAVLCKYVPCISAFHP